MSQQAELVWVMGILLIAFLVWFGGAKSQQREREARQRELEAKEHERAVMLRFDALDQLLARPETTLEDVKRMVLNTMEGTDIVDFRGSVE